LGSGPGFGGIDCGQQSLHRNSSARDELRAATPKRGGKWSRPNVLVDQDARRATRFEHATGIGDVVLVE
jgi:hypothetical protein